MMPDSIRASLADAALPRLEIHMLWQHVLGCTRAWLTAHDTDPLPATSVKQFQALRARRLHGEPMAYLLGWREFMGHAFVVSPAVLIPRPETESLVEEALRAAQRLRHNIGHSTRSHTVRALDLGTGSGAIAVSLALAEPDLHVTATDVNTAALDVARHNAQQLGARVQWRQGEWYDALLPQDCFDLIVSNPPYIACDDAHLRAGDLRFEPRAALTDGGDGLTDLHAIIAGAPRFLAPGGELWVEHGWDQAARVRDWFSARGFSAVRSVADLANIDRITGGRWPPPFTPTIGIPP